MKQKHQLLSAFAIRWLMVTLKKKRHSCSLKKSLHNRMSLAELDQQLVDLQLQYADLYIPMASGLSQEDIDAIVAVKNGRELARGSFGETTPVTYQGKEYLRKSMRLLTFDPYTKATFDNEVKLMKILTANPKTRPFVPFFYGSALGSTAAGKPVGYIVMERLVGMTLENLMTQRFFVEEEYNKLMSQIYDILNVFHDEGFLHKDLHPQNIFVTMNGNEIVAPILIDFGLSSLQTRKLTYKRNQNTLKNTRFGNEHALKDRLRNPYERGFRSARSQLANYSSEYPAYKPRDYETMRLTAAQEQSLRPLEQAIEAKRAERNTLATSSLNARKAAWQASLLADNTARQNSNRQTLFSGLKIKSSLQGQNTTTTVVPEADAFVKEKMFQLFEVLRSNGVLLGSALELAKSMGEELQTFMISKLVWEKDPSQTLEEAYAGSKSSFEAKAAELLEKARQIKTPTSFYGGRKQTRRKQRKTRKSKH